MDLTDQCDHFVPCTPIMRNKLFRNSPSPCVVPQFSPASSVCSNSTIVASQASSAGPRRYRKVPAPHKKQLSLQVVPEIKFKPIKDLIDLCEETSLPSGKEVNNNNLKKEPKPKPPTPEIDFLSEDDIWGP